MPLSPLAGKPAPPELLIEVDALLRAYEALYKLCAESFTSEAHPDRIIVEARIILRNALGSVPR